MNALNCAIYAIPDGSLNNSCTHGVHDVDLKKIVQFAMHLMHPIFR